MISEKEMFLNMWEKEFQTTLKVLKVFPVNRENFKPHEISKSAKELAWIFVTEEKVMIDGALNGEIKFGGHTMPATINEVISEYEKSHQQIVDKVKSFSEEKLNETIKFHVAAKTLGDVRKMDILWLTVMDMIHHRGQFSIYLRLVGAKVPSIYGPSADEPWS